MANHAGAFRRNRRECLFVWGDIVHPHRFLRANFAVEIAYSIGSYRGIFPQSGIANLIVLHEISENLVSAPARETVFQWRPDFRGIFPQSGIANLIVLHEISENLVSTGRRSRGLERI